MDTEILLALLASRIENSNVNQATLLEVLVECNGDVDSATRALSARLEAESSGKKRKRSQGLDGWIGQSQSPTKTISSSDKSKNKSKPPSRDLSRNPAPSISLSPSKSHQSTKRRHVSPSPSIKDDRERETQNTNKPASKGKIITNSEFLQMLRQPNSSKSASRPPRLPPLTLATPSLVKQHTPCTLHHSILPPELACRLFYTMLDASKGWQKNRWWLFDRVVESPHTTSFYVRHDSSAISDNESDMREAALYWYNGRQTVPPLTFLPEMEAACEIVERVVNAEIHKRQRFPLEWGGDRPGSDSGEDGEKIIWRANVAAANRYAGAKESVGFHSDQLTYLGPYPTIASLSLGTSRIFRLREVIPEDDKDTHSARTYNIPLTHNSLLIMHASTQEMFKHAIPPQSAIDLFNPPFPPPRSSDNSEQDPAHNCSSNARINITFRFYRPDYRSETTPRCRCGVPCILRPDMKNRYSLRDEASGQMSKEEGSSRTAGDSSPKNMVDKYWWTCYAGAQNEGKGCGFWKVMDVVAEGRGPFVGPVPSNQHKQSQEAREPSPVVS